MLRFFVATGLACAWIVACSADVADPYDTPTTTTMGMTGPSSDSGAGGDSSTSGGTDSGGGVDAGDAGGNDADEGNDDGEEEDGGDSGDTSSTSTTTTTTTTSTTGGSGTCGDGEVSNTEQCDGMNLNGYDCTSLGYTGGTLGCDPVMCTFDTSMCSNDDGGTSGG